MTDRSDIIARYEAGTLPQFFVERIRRRRSANVGDACRKLLVRLHNAGIVDLLNTARNIDQCPISQTDYFMCQHVFVDLIPKLNAEVPAMLAAVKALVARAGDDGTAGMPHGAYRIWAESDGRALATLKAIDPDDAADAAYVFLGLQSLAANEPSAALDHAIILLAGNSLPARSAAAKAIGTLPLTNSEARTRAANALEAARALGSDDNLLGHILMAICEIARAAPEMEPSALTLIAAASPDVGERAIHQVSLELLFHATDLQPAITAALTAIAKLVPVQNLQTLRNIDHATSALIRAGRIDEGLALIVPLISAHETLASLEVFNMTRYVLVELDVDRLASVIVRWLMTLEANLGLAALSLVREHHGSPLVLEFDATSLALSDAEAVLLSYRAIGYLFIHPITAASLVLSLIRSTNAEVRQAMANILFEPLLISYSGELAEWLNTKAKNTSDHAHSTIVNLLARLDTYMEGIRKTGWINELRPSERERLIETHRQQESMRQVHKEAEKRSVLMSIMNRSVLLYGNRSISYFTEPDGKKQRHEMKLNTMSHSFESPRLDNIEPFELDYTLRVFRTMRSVP